MAKKSFSDELEHLKEYLRSNDNEDAKRPLIYPLFKKLFPEKFKIESNAKGADVYVEGQLIVECKTEFSQWLEGFYQALHYHRKYGLTFSTVFVIAHKFIAIWKLNKLPEFAVRLERTASTEDAPNDVGKKNAKKTTAAEKIELKNSAIYWLEPKDLEGDIFAGAKNLTTESFEILKILNNLDSDRIQINTHNFINTIDKMKSYFGNPIDAVHAFYTIVAYWDITSTVAESEQGDLCVIGFRGTKRSDNVIVPSKQVKEFKKFIETQYVFTNEGSGLTVDYYFSRFDEVLAKIDPEYVKQHGIFFTDSNLSKFALWFAKNHFPSNIDEDFIVFDPAGGSGNLVSSWRGKLKHKIISELQPDLLRTIERRMKADPFHLETGFTIVPKTVENKGLNFLDRNAEDYLEELKKAVKASTNLEINKPIAFLLNPPYKNTKENEGVRVSSESNYKIDKTIIEIAGEEATNERYLAFLGQIINLSKRQFEEKLNPIVLVFTPTSWLIPRPAFVHFKKVWDSYFEYESGFIVTSNEFFKLDGKWPLAFTIWNFKPKKERVNDIKVFDYTYFSNSDLNGVSWFSQDDKTINSELKLLCKKGKLISLSKNRGTLREKFDLKLYDFIRTPNNSELNSKDIIGGLPLNDERRKNNKTYGVPNSEYIGFLDNCSPARIKPRGDLNRFSKGNLNSVWFRIDTAFKDINKSKVFSGPADNRSYCASDIESAKATFSWYCITKAIAGKYPLWANQCDIWSPNIKTDLEQEWHSLCFAYVLAENRCVVTIFEKDNPVAGAPEVFVNNPLAPLNKDCFWYKVLDKEVYNGSKLAIDLVDKIKQLYRRWNLEYCKGQKIEHVGLQDEPYFKYFGYPDFLTPHSGLIQIRKYAENEGLSDLLEMFSEISDLTKLVKAEIYRILVEEFHYFE